MTHFNTAFSASSKTDSAFDDLTASLGEGRPHPTEDALVQLGRALMTELVDVISDTALEDYQTTLGEALIGAFHSAAGRIERDAEKTRMAQDRRSETLALVGAFRQSVAGVVSAVSAATGELKESAGLLHDLARRATGMNRDALLDALVPGAQGVVLGCTELPLIVGPQDSCLPTFDTTALHAMAAVDFALAA